MLCPSNTVAIENRYVPDDFPGESITAANKMKPQLHSKYFFRIALLTYRLKPGLVFQDEAEGHTFDRENSFAGGVGSGLISVAA